MHRQSVVAHDRLQRHVFELSLVFESERNFLRVRTRRCYARHVNMDFSLSTAIQAKSFSQFTQKFFYFPFRCSSSLIIHFERFKRHQHPARKYFSSSSSSASCCWFSVVTVSRLTRKLVLANLCTKVKNFFHECFHQK